MRFPHVHSEGRARSPIVRLGPSAYRQPHLIPICFPSCLSLADPLLLAFSAFCFCPRRFSCGAFYPSAVLVPIGDLYYRLFSPSSLFSARLLGCLSSRGCSRGPRTNIFRTVFWALFYLGVWPFPGTSVFARSFPARYAPFALSSLFSVRYWYFSPRFVLGSCCPLGALESDTAALVAAVFFSLYGLPTLAAAVNLSCIGMVTESSLSSLRAFWVSVPVVLSCLFSVLRSCRFFSYTTCYMVISPGATLLFVIFEWSLWMSSNAKLLQFNSCLACKYNSLVWFFLHILYIDCYQS